MRCLITGASGWSGFSFVQAWAERYGKESLQLMVPPTPLHKLEARRAEALKAQGFNLIQHDLLDAPFPADSIQEFDILLHFAAFTHTEKNSPAVHVNDRGTRNLLEALGDKLKGTRVIYFGSCASLDIFNPAPDGVDEEQECHPLTVYGQTKLQGEVFLKELSTPFHYNWTILRLPTVYGPGYRPGGLFDIIKSGMEGFHPITRINWPGSLSLLYIDDLVAQLLHICENGAAKNTLIHLADPTPVPFIKLFGEQRRLPLPQSVGRALRAILLFFVRRIRWPHALFISGWRLCHLLGDSMVFNTANAQQQLPLDYTGFDEGMRRTYQNKIPGLE
ncbi:NAD(P)-dependent oxidoreductase [Pontiellaceae bacterium B12227]|nr:NAD(P)-dependent oxidoreductase [Pontiellaceae bacterium B12227]